MSGTKLAKTESALVCSGDLVVETGKLLVTARRILRKGPEQLTQEDTAVWSFILERNGITAEEVMPALLEWMSTSEWYPAPANIIGLVKKAREKKAREERHAKGQEAREAERLEKEMEAQRVAAMTPEEREAEAQARRDFVADLRAQRPWLYEEGVKRPERTEIAKEAARRADSVARPVDGMRRVGSMLGDGLGEQDDEDNV